MPHGGRHFVVVIIGNHNLPRKIHLRLQIITIQIVIGSENLQIMLRNKGISDAVGNHSLNGFLVPAGHNDIRGNARFFKDRLVDHADSLALAADDKGVMIPKTENSEEVTVNIEPMSDPQKMSQPYTLKMALLDLREIIDKLLKENTYGH